MTFGAILWAVQKGFQLAIEIVASRKLGNEE